MSERVDSFCSNNIATTTCCTFECLYTGSITTGMCCNCTFIFNMHVFNLNTYLFIAKCNCNCTVGFCHCKSIVSIYISIRRGSSSIRCSPSMIQYTFKLVRTSINIFVYLGKSISSKRHVICSICWCPITTQISTCTYNSNYRRIFTPSRCTAVPSTIWNCKAIFAVCRNSKVSCLIPLIIPVIC